MSTTAEKLAQAEADLAEARAARSKILLAQSYGEDGRNLARANLDSVSRLINELEAKVDRLSGGRMFALGTMRRPR